MLFLALKKESDSWLSEQVAIFSSLKKVILGYVAGGSLHQDLTGSVWHHQFYIHIPGPVGNRVKVPVHWSPIKVHYRICANDLLVLALFLHNFVMFSYIGPTLFVVYPTEKKILLLTISRYIFSLIKKVLDQSYHTIITSVLSQMQRWHMATFLQT